jgi:hypothetical protein
MLHDDFLDVANSALPTQIGALALVSQRISELACTKNNAPVR